MHLYLLTWRLWFPYKAIHGRGSHVFHIIIYKVLGLCTFYDQIWIQKVHESGVCFQERGLLCSNPHTELLTFHEWDHSVSHVRYKDRDSGRSHITSLYDSLVGDYAIYTLAQKILADSNKCLSEIKIWSRITGPPNISLWTETESISVWKQLNSHWLSCTTDVHFPFFIPTTCLFRSGRIHMSSKQDNDR